MTERAIRDGQSPSAAESPPGVMTAPSAPAPDEPPLPSGWQLAAAGVLAVIFLHFALIGLMMGAPWLMPPAMSSALEAYQVPFFTQDWRLFAPRPDIHDYEVYARATYRVGAGVERTPWVALLAPLVAEVQAHRLSSASVRVEVVHKAALLTVWAAGPVAQLPSGRAAIADRWDNLERQPASLIVLERVASAALADAFPGQTFETVQLMVTARAVVSDGDEASEAPSTTLLFHPLPFPSVAR